MGTSNYNRTRVNLDYYWKYLFLSLWIVAELVSHTVPSSVSIFQKKDENSCGKPLTVGNQSCHIPFTYRGVVYNNCITENNNGTPWCSLTKQYDGIWDNCARCSSDGKIQKTCSEVTTGGTAGSGRCAIPFYYKSRVYYGCTGTNYHTSWCSSTPIYNGSWGNCNGCVQAASLATINCIAQNKEGKTFDCFFPFEYEGVWYDKCTDYKHDRPWCSFTDLYVRHWGDCSEDCITINIVEVQSGTTRPPNRILPGAPQGTTRPSLPTTRPNLPLQPSKLPTLPATSTAAYILQKLPSLPPTSTAGRRPTSTEPAPVFNPVVPPATPPVFNPVAPPEPPPVNNPVVPPEPPPVNNNPVAPPVNNPVAPPEPPPVNNPVVPPEPPPVNNPVAPPEPPPVNNPVAPPEPPPVNNPVAPPEPPPVNNPVAPPEPPPVNNPVAPPEPPPVNNPVAPPEPPPVNNPVVPPEPLPVSPDVPPDAREEEARLSTTTAAATTTTAEMTTATTSTSVTTEATTAPGPTVSCREYTSGGTSNGRQCVFPFYYEGKKFYECTTYKHNSPWCSASTNYTGLWGQCIGCEEPDRGPCIERTANAPFRCKIPFTYNHVTYFKCTTVEEVNNRPWCSFTELYARRWGYCLGCDPTTTGSNPVPGPTAPVTTEVAPTEAPPSCGIRYFPNSLSRPAIVGGPESLANSWPWQLSLRKFGFHRCGASIVSERWVITAAHCVDGSSDLAPFELIAGMHTQSTADEPTRQVRRIQEMIVHQEYRTIHVGPDIAALYVDQPFNFSQPQVAPICMPDREVFDGEDCYMTGWGSTKNTGSNNVLREADLPVIPKSTCNSNEWWFGLVAVYEICVGQAEGNKGACFGDSGGPLSILRNGRYVLGGVTSWIPTDCIAPNKASVYTSAYAMREWISQNTGINIPNV